MIYVFCLIYLCESVLLPRSAAGVACLVASRAAGGASCAVKVARVAALVASCAAPVASRAALLVSRFYTEYYV